MRAHGSLPIFIVCQLACAVAAADEPALQPIAIGKPVRIEVFPSELKLAGPRSQRQLVVTGHYEGGSVQDLTWALVNTPAFLFNR